MDPKNKQLLAMLNKGDEKAYLKVYDHFSKKIFRFIYYQVGQDKHHAEDLSQQTFFKTWEYISNGKEIENIQAFLYRIAKNLVIDHWRAKGKEQLPLKDELIETTESAQGGPRWLEKIEAKINVELLEKSLGNIHSQYREILLMRYLEELTIDEIAEVLDKDKNNVYVLIHRATKALRKELEK